MTCLDDAKFVGPVSLFAGVETSNWTVQQFVDLANWAKAQGITTLFIKAFQWGSTAGAANDGLWYGGMTGIDAIYKAIKATGMGVVFYGYLWGDAGNIAGDIRDITAILTKYRDVMLDMEGDNWAGDTSGQWAAQIADALISIPGRVWLSYPADFANNGQTPFMAAMAKVVNVYLPMAYDDYLVSVYKSQLDGVNPQACVMPTLDLTNEFGTNDVLGNVQKVKANGSQAISLWYEQFAKANPALTDKVVAAMGGNMPTPTPAPGPVPLVLHNGCVADLQFVYQVEWNESPTECGPYTASLLKYAGLPGKGPTGSAEQVDQFADQEYSIYIGPNTNTDFNGSSIENMHQFFHDAGNLHYWDIGAIGDTSDHHQDIARIQRALDAGYPVAATTLMSTVQRPDGSYVYPGVDAYHILPIVGYDHQGNWLVNDEDNQNDPWPNKYQQWPMYLHWASIVQLVGPDPVHPWLKTIPSGDPLDPIWTGFNAQNFATQETKFMEQQFNDYWPTTNPFTATNSKIRQAAFAAFMAKVIPAVFPACAEVETVNWSGGKIRRQGLSNGGAAEFTEADFHVRLYDSAGRQLFYFA